jgi:hypothetical protein
MQRLGRDRASEFLIRNRESRFFPPIAAQESGEGLYQHLSLFLVDRSPKEHEPMPGLHLSFGPRPRSNELLENRLKRAWFIRTRIQDEVYCADRPVPRDPEECRRLNQERKLTRGLAQPDFRPANRDRVREDDDVNACIREDEWSSAGNKRTPSNRFHGRERRRQCAKYDYMKQRGRSALVPQQT